MTYNKKHLYWCSWIWKSTEAHLICTEAHLGSSVSSASWVWVCPTCVHSGPKQQKLWGSFFCFHCDVFGTKGHAQPPLLKPHPLTFHCPKQGTGTSPIPLWQECTLVTIQVEGANICFAIIQIITPRSSPKWWSIMAKELQMQCPWSLPSLPWCPHVAKSGRVGVFLPESFTLTP